jgi:hypothetical protein
MRHSEKLSVLGVHYAPYVVEEPTLKMKLFLRAKGVYKMRVHR